VGRRKSPIVGDGPVPTLAVELRALRATSGMPTYRQMARKANFSHNGLSQADRGIRLPTWDCVRAYLKGCDVTAPEEIERWYQRWESTKKAAEMREALAPPPVPHQRTPEDHGRDPRAARERRRFDVNLAFVHTMEQLVDALNDLIVDQGINVAALSRRISPNGEVTRQQHVLADAAARAVLTGRQRPTVQLVAQIVLGCGGNRADAIWWVEHWKRIDNSERSAKNVLDQLKERVRLETSVVTSPDEDHGRVTTPPVIDGEVTGVSSSSPGAAPPDDARTAEPASGHPGRRAFWAAVIAGVLFAALVMYLAR
jgi:hypothetical protein